MKKVYPNDLATTNFELAEEWNYEKNGDLTPNMLTKGSSKIVWWKCHVCSYEWKTTVSSRGGLKRGCPKCGRLRSGGKHHI